MIIAVDFDGTIVTHEYPRIGRDIDAVPVLKELIENGHKIILYTMRSKEHLEEAMQNLDEMIGKCKIEYKHQVLFSRRCFKQRGAVYQPEASISDSVKSELAESFAFTKIVSGTR